MKSLFVAVFFICVSLAGNARSCVDLTTAQPSLFPEDRNLYYFAQNILMPAEKIAINADLEQARSIFSGLVNKVAQQSFTRPQEWKEVRHVMDLIPGLFEPATSSKWRLKFAAQYSQDPRWQKISYDLLKWQLIREKSFEHLNIAIKKFVEFATAKVPENFDRTAFVNFVEANLNPFLRQNFGGLEYETTADAPYITLVPPI